jgi:hypothetical protein
MTNISRSLAAAGVFALGACGGSMKTTEQQAAPLPSLNDVTEAQWAALANRRIFFGHQSVGGNIMEGVAEVLAANPSIPLKVVESRDLSDSLVPAFHHTLVGRNDFPLEKFEDFVTVADGFGAAGGIAMLKLCYIDIHTHTDPQELFDAYRRNVDALKSRKPSLTIVHFTAPLTNIENWKGRVRATLTGANTQRERNLVRHRYNELLREAYEGKEPVFDIARLESTLPDGRRVHFQIAGQEVPLLAPQHTDDGGHLNARARRMVAEQLLIFLARLEPPKSTVVAAGS